MLKMSNCFLLKIFIFHNFKNLCVLYGPVFVMFRQECFSYILGKKCQLCEPSFEISKGILRNQNNVVGLDLFSNQR